MGGFGLPGHARRAGGPGGFDVSQLGQMLTQLGQMLSQAQSSGDGPVNYDLAGQLARQQLAATTSSLTGAQRAAVSDAVKLAELWLDAATDFPAGATETKAWSASEWVDASLPTWKRLCDPVAQRVSGAWLEAMPEEMRTAAGPMLAMLGQMGGLAFGSQLGHGLAQLAAEVLTSTEIGIPVGPDRVAALLPENVEKFTRDLDRPASEVMIFLAAREAAHHRLFTHVPWLKERLLGAVEQYARGIRVDSSRIEELARGHRPVATPRPSRRPCSRACSTPETTPEQKAALARLETLLALVEGWVDAVVADAVGERLPGAEALRETLRRRRASGGPAEQTFATVVGLELRPRRLRAAAELWRLLGEQRGIDGPGRAVGAPGPDPDRRRPRRPGRVRRPLRAGRPDRRAGEAGRPGARRGAPAGAQPAESRSADADSEDAGRRADDEAPPAPTG